MKKTTTLTLLTLFVAVLAAAGCATYTTHYDYDPEARFEVLKTFNWLNPPGKGQAVDELTLKRIKASLERQLAQKGYSIVTSNPDFLIAIHGGKETKVNVVDWGYTYRPNEHYRYGYASRQKQIDVYQYETGTLILDFVDTASQELIWRGSVSKVIDPNPTPEKRDKVINEAVARVLEKFPPPLK